MQSLKQPRVRKAKSQGDRMLDAILNGINVKVSKTIRPFDLRQLGYVFHDTPKVVFRKPFELRMVLDEHTKHEVGFCFVLNTENNLGVVLPHSFTHYLETYGESPTSLDGTSKNEASPNSTTHA